MGFKDDVQVLRMMLEDRTLVLMTRSISKTGFVYELAEKEHVNTLKDALDVVTGKKKIDDAKVKAN